jgi:hypothetical protein
MAQRDRIYPDTGTEFPTAPPPPGAYYSVKDLNGIPPPATYQRRRRSGSPCCCCLLWLCSIFTILIVAVGLAILIFWLVVHPRAPQFDVNTVHLSGFNVSSPGPDNTNITYQITATNPNKHIDFYYSDISIFVQASGDDVGQGTVADFNQGHQNTTIINGSISQNGVNIDGTTLSKLLQDPTKVPFYAEVDLKAKLKIGSLKSGNFKVTVKCNIDLNLQIQSGSQLNGHSCSVHW